MLDYLVSLFEQKLLTQWGDDPIHADKKPTVEETHKRQTYLIDKDLIRRLERLAKRQPKGFKTAVVNEGIRRVLDEIEQKSQHEKRPYL